MPLFLSFVHIIRKQDLRGVGVTYLFIFGQSCFVMYVRCNQVESMFL